MTTTALYCAYFSTEAGFALLGIALRPLNGSYEAKRHNLAGEAIMLRRFVAGTPLPAVLTKQVEGSADWLLVVETAKAAAYLRQLSAERAIMAAAPPVVYGHLDPAAPVYDHAADNY